MNFDIEWARRCRDEDDRYLKRTRTIFVSLQKHSRSWPHPKRRKRDLRYEFHGRNANRDSSSGAGGRGTAQDPRAHFHQPRGAMPSCPWSEFPRSSYSQREAPRGRRKRRVSFGEFCVCFLQKRALFVRAGYKLSLGPSESRLFLSLSLSLSRCGGVDPSVVAP